MCDLLSLTIRINYKCFPTLQVVIVWILCHASVEESPCEVVYSILFVLNSLCDYFSIEVIMYEVVKMGLDTWETQNNSITHKLSYSTCTAHGIQFLKLTSTGRGS